MAPSKRSSGGSDENIENHSDPTMDHDEEEPSHHRKKKKVKIMSNSGQTESDRRALRQQQRKLQEDIVSGVAGRSGEGSEDEEEDDEPAFQKMRKMNNTLWEQVRYTREAVLDSENVDLIAANAARQAEAIVQVPRYDAIRLAQMLVKKASVRTASGSTHFGWKGFGFQTGICFNSLPSHVSFLYGPLDAEYKVKERKKSEPKKKQASQEEEGEEEQQPEEMDQTQKKESDGNELSAVETHMKVMYIFCLFH